jgi:short-subunit dehydrogenase
MGLPAPAADHTCLVTGASSGIGAEIARELARRGRGVTLVARRGERLEAFAAEIRAAHGVRAEVITADLADPDSRRALVEELDRRRLTLDVLVNNAGIGTFGPVQRSDPERECAVVRTDAEAVVDLCSRLVPGMVARAAGAVLNVASTAAYQPLPGQASYAAAKAFVLSYSLAVRAELEGTGVTVTVLSPGPVETEFGTVAQVNFDVRSSPMPRFMWRSAEQVARAGVEGMLEGRRTVIPGWGNKVTATGGHLLPKRLLVPILARQHPALRAGDGPEP